jgi:hypothetical protein
MYQKLSGVVLATAILAGMWVALIPAPVAAQYVRGRFRDPPKQADPDRPKRDEHVSILDAPPHHGRISSVGPYYIEVVFRSWETRLFLFNKSEWPLSMRGVQGQVAMQVPGVQQPYVFLLEYVPQPVHSREQDYMAAVADVSRVPDRQMQVTFQLNNLPLQDSPQETFTPPFVASPLGVPVLPVPITAADNEAIVRQRVCPVTGIELGRQGPPVKVLVGQQPMYLSCRGCIPELENHPESYVTRLVSPPDSPTGDLVR